MKRLGTFPRDRQGATIIEFALVAPFFFLILMGIIEFGLIRFSQVAVEAAVAQASRAAAIGGANGGGCDRVCTIRGLVQQKTRGLINGTQVTIAAQVVGTGRTAAPDICLTDPPSTPGDCIPPLVYEDSNANGRYDPPSTPSLGNPGDVIELRVSFPWRVQIPGMRQLFSNGVYMISASTIVKNEPF